MMNIGGVFGAPYARYGVTNGPVDLNAHWALGNQGWTSNYGGETQYNTFDSSYTDQQMAGAKALMGQYTSPSIMGMAQAPVGGYQVPGANTFTPQEQQVLSNSYQNGFEKGVKIALDLNISNVNSIISEMKPLLAKNAQNQNLSSLQRDKLIETIDQLEEAERRLETIQLLRKQGASDRAAKEEVNGIKIQIAEIQNDGALLTAELQRELKTNLENKGIKTEGLPLINGLEEVNNVKEAEETDEATEAKAEPKAEKKDSTEASIICKKLFEAMDGTGTKNKLMKETLDEITPDNVIEVMEYWNKAYQHENNESLAKMFVWDANHRQKKEFGEKLTAALEQRAEKAGVDVSEQTTKLREELDSWWINNKTVYTNMDAMFETIQNKENPELAKAKAEKAEAEKAEAEKKAA